MSGRVKFFTLNGQCRVDFKVQQATPGNGSKCHWFWELRYFKECLRNSTQRHHQQVQRAQTDIVAHGVPQGEAALHIWQSKMSTKKQGRSKGPGMDVHMDVDSGSNTQAGEEPESMTGEAGEGTKDQQQVSTMLSVSTRAFITMLMMSMKCTRNGERQDQARRVMSSIMVWCIPEINKDIAVIVSKVLRQKAPNAEMKHSSVIDAMVQVTNKPEAIPLIVKLTQILEDDITQKEECGVMALETHIIDTSIQTTYQQTINE
jgi:hypothetical protein